VVELKGKVILLKGKHRFLRIFVKVLHRKKEKMNYQFDMQRVLSKYEKSGVSLLKV
jgi:hypothetical protein